MIQITPVNPTDGQTFDYKGRTYTYSAESKTWSFELSDAELDLIGNSQTLVLDSDLASYNQIIIGDDITGADKNKLSCFVNNMRLNNGDFVVDDLTNSAIRFTGPLLAGSVIALVVEGTT